MCVGIVKLRVSFAEEPLHKRIYSAKETYDFIDPTDRSHPMNGVGAYV